MRNTGEMQITCSKNTISFENFIDKYNFFSIRSIIHMKSNDYILILSLQL